MTIQDMGRYGFQQYGVIPSGAMDTFALRVANLLVGNKEDEACFEITFGKSAIRFHDRRAIAVTGGDLNPHLNGKPIPIFRTISVNKGDELHFKLPKNGFRAYLAISGGFDIDKTLNSKSTDEKSHIGGLFGRSILSNDDVKLSAHSIANNQMLEYLKHLNGNINWGVSYHSIYATDKVLNIKALPGLDQHLFKKEHLKKFENIVYTISAKSNRMGYRLDHSERIELMNDQDIFSEAVSFGTVQIPPNGKPIILMADAQTIGGYPKIAQILKTEHSKLAQARPGEQLRFTFTNLHDAEKSYFEQEFYISQIKEGIKHKLQ